MSAKNPCPKPPPNVLKTLDFDLDLAVKTLPKLPSGSLKAATDSKVYKTVSQALLDSRTAAYMRCLSHTVEGYTKTQAVWLQTMAELKSTNPTAKEFSQFLKDHPFPGESGSAPVPQSQPVPTPTEKQPQSVEVNQEIHGKQIGAVGVAKKGATININASPDQKAAAKPKEAGKPAKKKAGTSPTGSASVSVQQSVTGSSNAVVGASEGDVNISIGGGD